MPKQKTSLTKNDIRKATIYLNRVRDNLYKAQSVFYSSESFGHVHRLYRCITMVDDFYDNLLPGKGSEYYIPKEKL